MTKLKQKIVSYFCIVALVVTISPAMSFAAQASDIANHWAESQITRLIDKGVINRNQDGTFQPDKNITRAEFMAMINRAFQFSEKAEISYTDVPAGVWYTDTIKQAKAAGYISGYVDGTIKPEQAITRQEAAIIIAKIKNLSENPAAANRFRDASSIPGWCKGAVGVVAEIKIMNGYPDDSYKGGNNFTRAEAATVLCKAIGLEKTADLVLKNGIIYTMDEAGTTASAIAAVGDEIVYVGDDAGVENYIGTDTEVIDLNGKMVTPGFVDGHIHPTLAPPPDILDLADVEPTVPAYQAALQEYAESHPNLKVINGEGLQIKAFPDGKPDKSMIDEVISTGSGIYVIISDTSFHGMLVNTAVLAASEITKDTAAPPGGQIYKDADGNPTGYFSDADSLLKNIPFEYVEPSEEECIDAFNSFVKDMNAKGITAIDGGGSDSGVYKMIDDYSKTGDMTMRVNLSYRAQGFTTADAIQAVQVLKDNRQYNSDYQRIGQVKNIIDGVPEGKTVLLKEPYDPAAEMPADYCGPQYCTQKELSQFVATIDKAGYQVLIHAMGDGGAYVYLNAVEYAQEQNGARDARHTMVHANFVDASDIARMAELGVYGALQPIWCYYDPIFSALEKKHLGAERFAEEYAVKDMVGAGVILSGSADWSISDNRPLFGIETGVTQCSPYPGQQGDPVYLRSADQGVSVMDMLKFYTINGAKQMFMDDIIGSLEVGKKADMVVLAQDITKIDVEDISETEITDTIFDGKIIYKK